MAEVPRPRIGLAGAISEDLRVAHRAAGLDDGGHAGIEQHPRAVRERKEGVGRRDRTRALRLALELACLVHGAAAGIHAAHLAGSPGRRASRRGRAGSRSRRHPGRDARRGPCPRSRPGGTARRRARPPSRSSARLSGEVRGRHRPQSGTSRADRRSRRPRRVPSEASPTRRRLGLVASTSRAPLSNARATTTSRKIDTSRSANSRSTVPVTATTPNAETGSPASADLPGLEQGRTLRGAARVRVLADHDRRAAHRRARAAAADASSTLLYDSALPWSGGSPPANGPSAARGSRSPCRRYRAAGWWGP